jgi:hypothetical protein
MASFSIANALVALAIAALFTVTLSSFLGLGHDKREPPYIPTAIPFIGHLIHLLRERSDYLKCLNQKYHYGIYTIPILSLRNYVVNSPEWAVGVHRAHKGMSINKHFVQALRGLFFLDAPTMKIVEENMDDQRGDRSGLLPESQHLMWEALGPGPSLDEMISNFLTILTPQVNSLAKEGPERVQIWDWVRHHFNVTSATAVWGPKHPLALDESAERDFWTVVDNTVGLLLTPFGSYFLKEAYAARGRVIRAWEQYSEADGWEDGSRIAKRRAELCLERYGLSKKNHGRFEVAILFAVLVNTVPSTFWLLSFVFADQALLAELRREVDACVQTDRDIKKIISVGELRTRCAALNSAAREALRIAAPMNINRDVIEDTLVTNHSTGESYTLKKGGFVTFATNVIHNDPNVFGEGPTKFDARRFMRTVTKDATESSEVKTADIAAPFRDEKGKVHPGAFRTFGGGTIHLSAIYPVQVLALTPFCRQQHLPRPLLRSHRDAFLRRPFRRRF